MMSCILSQASFMAPPPRRVPLDAIQAPVIGDLDVSVYPIVMRSRLHPKPSAHIMA